MNSAIITVAALTKEYTIFHQDRERYVALRDVLAGRIKKGFANLRKGFSRNSGNISKKKEIFCALNDLSFDVAQGDRLAIIGRNGAGKSTLLKILSRITEPTSGRVEMCGRAVSLLEVGTGFHPELTGRENIFLNGAILGMSKSEIRRKFDEIVDFAEVEKFLDTPVKRFSSGMYVRLAFSVAAHLESEILIVDEVLAVGDAKFQSKCMGKMEEVSSGGRTVLFVSHSMATVQRLCNRGIVLDAGKITFVGDTMGAIEHYMAGSAVGGLITSHLEKTDKRVCISNIIFNGAESDEIHLSPGSNELRIQIYGNVSEPLRMDYEMRICDMYGIPLAFFSPGHLRGYCEITPSGDFTLEKVVRLPRITRGKYHVSLALTDPGVHVWASAPNAVILHSPGASTNTGVVFDYDKGTGWVILSEDTN